MAAALTLRRRQARYARPAEVTHDSGLSVRQELIAGDTYARQQQIQRSRPPLPHRSSRTFRVYSNDCRIASRSGSIPNHF
jgi:hypothetical protein